MSLEAVAKLVPQVALRLAVPRQHRRGGRLNLVHDVAPGDAAGPGSGGVWWSLASGRSGDELTIKRSRRTWRPTPLVKIPQQRLRRGRLPRAAHAPRIRAKRALGEVGLAESGWDLPGDPKPETFNTATSAQDVGENDQ